MTEFNVWCSNCESCVGGDNSWAFAKGTASYMLNHLANGASAGLMWEGYDSYYNLSGCWSYWGLFAVDNINAVHKTYTPRKGFYTMAQISKFVRPGAQRISVSGVPAGVKMLGFYHPVSGVVTLTGVNGNTSPVNLSVTALNLPAFSSLDLYYTTSSTNLGWGGSLPVANGALAVTVPADCVFTLTESTAVSALLTSPADGATFSSPANVVLAASASTTSGTITNVEFLNGATSLGQTNAAPHTLSWSNVPPGAYTLTARASSSLGAVAVSPAVHITVLGPLARITVSPTNATVSVYSQQPFAATGTDALGGLLQPQPAFAWSVNGGGTIDANGLFTAGGWLEAPSSSRPAAAVSAARPWWA